MWFVVGLLRNAVLLCRDLLHLYLGCWVTEGSHMAPILPPELGFRVWVWGLGFGVYGLGFTVWVWGLWFRVWGLWFRV